MTQHLISSLVQMRVWSFHIQAHQSRRKFAPKCTNKAKICTNKVKKFAPTKIAPKETTTIKLQTKIGWGCTFLGHFWLPLVKIRVVIGCGKTYEPPSQWALTPLGPNLHHTLGLCENSHQQVCTSWTSSRTDKILSKMPQFTVWLRSKSVIYISALYVLRCDLVCNIAPRKILSHWPPHQNFSATAPQRPEVQKMDFFQLGIGGFLWCNFSLNGANFCFIGAFWC